MCVCLCFPQRGVRSRPPILSSSNLHPTSRGPNNESPPLRGPVLPRAAEPHAISRPVRTRSKAGSFLATVVYITPSVALTSRRRGESGTFGAVGPVLSNSMFMGFFSFPFLYRADGAAQATSTRKYHHAPFSAANWCLGTIVPLVGSQLRAWDPFSLSFLHSPIKPALKKDGPTIKSNYITIKVDAVHELAAKECD